MGTPSIIKARGTIIILALESIPVAAMIGLTPFSFDLAQIAATAYEKHAHIKDSCAKDRRLKFVKVSKPIIMHTPSNANNNPTLLINESRSSLKTIDARAKVIIAVPFRIEANPLSIWVCPMQ